MLSMNVDNSLSSLSGPEVCRELNDLLIQVCGLKGKTSRTWTHSR